jgi:hypothetical protein
MNQVGYKDFHSFGFEWLGLIIILGTIINLAPYIAKLLTRRFCVSFVIFNEYTRTLSTDHITTNGKLKWLVITAVVGWASYSIHQRARFSVTPFRNASIRACRSGAIGASFTCCKIIFSGSGAALLRRDGPSPPLGCLTHSPSAPPRPLGHRPPRPRSRAPAGPSVTRGPARERGKTT